MPYTRRTYAKPATRKPAYQRPSRYGPPARSKAMTYKRKAPVSRIRTTPFSFREYAKLKYKYSDDVISSSTQFTTGVRSYFNLNNINQPLFAQSATDPLPGGFDSYATFFDKFKVYGAKIHLELGPNVTGQELTLVVYLINSSTTLDITGKTAREFSGVQRLYTYQLPTDKSFKFDRYVRIADLEALQPVQFNADLTQYVGTVTKSAAAHAASAPPRQCAIAFSLINNTTNASYGIPYEIDIEYYTQFTERISVPLSSTTA